MRTKDSFLYEYSEKKFVQDNRDHARVNASKDVKSIPTNVYCVNASCRIEDESSRFYSEKVYLEARFDTENLDQQMTTAGW